MMFCITCYYCGTYFQMDSHCRLCYKHSNWRKYMNFKSVKLSKSAIDKLTELKVRLNEETDYDIKREIIANPRYADILINIIEQL